jgi:hypothetical protein
MPQCALVLNSRLDLTWVLLAEAVRRRGFREGLAIADEGVERLSVVSAVPGRPLDLVGRVHSLGERSWRHPMLVSAKTIY